MENELGAQDKEITFLQIAWPFIALFVIGFVIGIVIFIISEVLR